MTNWTNQGIPDAYCFLPHKYVVPGCTCAGRRPTPAASGEPRLGTAGKATPPGAPAGPRRSPGGSGGCRRGSQRPPRFGPGGPPHRCRTRRPRPGAAGRTSPRAAARAGSRPSSAPASAPTGATVVATAPALLVATATAATALVAPRAPSRPRKKVYLLPRPPLRRQPPYRIDQEACGALRSHLRTSLVHHSLCTANALAIKDPNSTDARGLPD
jgi:hypothetical protein